MAHVVLDCCFSCALTYVEIDRDLALNSVLIQPLGLTPDETTNETYLLFVIFISVVLRHTTFVPIRGTLVSNVLFTNML